MVLFDFSGRNTPKNNADGGFYDYNYAHIGSGYGTGYEYMGEALPLPDSNGFGLRHLTKNNKYVPATVALQNSDIYSAVSQLSMDLANCKYNADTPRVQGIIDNPTDTANAEGFWQGMFAELLLDGNAYAYIWRNKNGTVNRLEYLRPDQVQIMLAFDGKELIYNLHFDEPDIGWMPMVPQSNVLHIRLLSQNGGKTGISPLSSLGSELKIKRSSNNLSQQSLEHAIDAPGILTVQKGGKLNAAERAARSRRFEKERRLSNHGPIVLDDLETFTPLEIKSNIAQLLNSVNWTSNQIAKAYMIPNSNLNGQGDQQSSLQMIQGYYNNTLNRYAQSIISELNTKFNAHVEVSTRTSYDPDGTIFAGILTDMVARGKILANNQVVKLLKDMNFFPGDLPEAEFNNILVGDPVPSTEGGETNDQESQSN